MAQEPSLNSTVLLRYGLKTRMKVFESCTIFTIVQKLGRIFCPTLITKIVNISGSTIKLRGRESEDWLIQLANREGAWPKRPYECFWSKVGVSRIGQG